jgi:hypothetical protein
MFVSVVWSRGVIAVERAEAPRLRASGEAEGCNSAAYDELAVAVAGPGPERVSPGPHFRFARPKQEPSTLCDVRLLLVLSGRELPAGEDARLSKEQRASRPASRAGRCSYSSNSVASSRSKEASRPLPCGKKGQSRRAGGNRWIASLGAPRPFGRTLLVHCRPQTWVDHDSLLLATEHDLLRWAADQCRHPPLSRC